MWKRVASFSRALPPSSPSSKAPFPLLELWHSTDIVSPQPPLPHAWHHQCRGDPVLPTRHVLVNPANERLEGTQFSYFPRGGPMPEHERGWNSSWWGGMTAGDGMLYPTQTVDGRVHAEGGLELKEALHLVRTAASSTNSTVFPFGTAHETLAFGALLRYGLTHVVHTVTPFHSTPQSHQLLASCYHAALDTAAASGLVPGGGAGTRIVTVVPLLGAGTRGFPLDEATDVSAHALETWLAERRAQPPLVRLVAHSMNDAQSWLSALRRRQALLKLVDAEN
jgi:O-acetyl-ADP-ribose deacetylase (regulator of RNase III)